MGGASGCPLTLPAPGVYNNTTDRTNGGAAYVGSSACRACHPGYAAQHRLHGHANQLMAVRGGPPAFPTEAGPAGVPDPPAGFAWADISYVIGGYTKTALFLDQHGFLLTTGGTGEPTRWNLRLDALGRGPEFVDFEPAASSPLPYAFSRFAAHTTGPVMSDPGQPMFQDNRPGIEGVWHEPGVQCEACHGPGSNHIPNPSARNLFVDSSGALTCRACHHAPFDAPTDEIAAADGFIAADVQWPELKASGGHRDFACTICHDPHRSVIYDRAGAVRNPCTACHTDMNMALHGGKVFRRGNYEEVLTCESCHMPFATRSATSASASVVGARGRMGDTRTHIFRIMTEPIDYRSFFSADGTKVVRDAEGRASVTVDFVCLRCHNEVALPTLAFTVDRASEIAIGVHRVFP